jgi:hypothetical protein
MISRVSSFRSAIAARAYTLLPLLALILAIAVPVLRAQTGGEGSITGTVTDSTGAAIPGVTITATNVASGVSTTRTTTGAGAYNIAPLTPGIYSVKVVGKGFKTLQQQNLAVDALNPLGFNPVLTVGAITDTVEVTTAPPVLDTTSATVGLVIENATYSELPIQINNSQRDATAFASLAPGTQPGARVPIVGGTGNYLGQLYLDGMPAETINQQGDNRLVSQGVDLDAVEQFQVVTSTPPAEYSGAGATNYTVKSGGNKYHGSAAEFVRNTAFDAWSFTNKWLTTPGINPVTNANYICAATATTQTVGANTFQIAPRSGCQKKAVEHQNELSLTFSGKVPHTANKLFFFVAYDKYHSRKGANPATYTVPTTLMNTGDFTELRGGVGTGGLTGVVGDPSAGGTNAPAIFDPTSNSCVGTVCTRTPFQGLKNGIPTYNVIPASYISPITQQMASFLPKPTNPLSLTNNWVGGIDGGFDNNVQNYRVDFDLSAKQRLSTIGAIGAVHYLNNYSTFLPLPYTGGTIANIFPRVFDVEDTYTITDKIINQLKYSETRFAQPQTAATDGQTKYQPATFGITNVPKGQASSEFPGAAFGTTGAVGTTLTGWTANSGGAVTQNVVPTTFAVLDNLQWLKGKHSLTMGFTYEWEDINSQIPIGYSNLVQLTYNSNSTAQYNNAASTLNGSSGNSYASYLLGAVGGSPTLGLQQAVAETGGRYRVAAPYFSDNWKVTGKLTLDLGLRWDYFSPFHEVKDHWSFLNPTQINSATGTPGDLQFAGSYGGAGVSCGCRTPVQTYWKNWGPRIGVIYAIDSKTIVRGGIARVFSQAGGVGGRGGNAGGTGQTGFNVNALATPESTSGAAAGPSFYLNNGTTFTGKGIANTDLFGKGFVFPTASAPNAAAQILQTGNYLNGVTATSVQAASSVSFADYYISGRAPEFTFFNFGIERSITKDMTLSVNYVGDQSHFLSTGGNVRGYWANQLNPVYLAALGGMLDSTGAKPILVAAATPANVAKAQTAVASIKVPAFFQTAATANPSSSTLTLAQGLTAFPQYSGVSDLWGSNSGNLSYHSLQITLLQRRAHGVNFNINYTYSKNLGDDGNFRSGFDIPAAALSGGGQSWHQDRIERSWTGNSVPQVFHAFGGYELPFGKNKIGGDSMLVRQLAGGWQISTIYTYSSGAPIAVTSGACTGTTYPGQGQCMPDVVPGSSGARINGSYGTGPNGTTACNLGIGSGCTQVKYLDVNQFKLPSNVSALQPTVGAAGQPQYLIGNAPRTAAYGLRNPGTQNIDISVHRTFHLPGDFATLVFEVDALNVWNKVTFSGPASTWNPTFSYATGAPVISNAGTFGTIGSIANSPRDFQFAGHINF